MLNTRETLQTALG